MDEEKKETTQVAEEAVEQKESQEQDSGLPKTQEELDALIEKRLARERKKLARQQTAQPAANPAAEQGSGQDNPAQNAQVDALAAKDRELLIVRAQLDALREGVVPSAVEDAVYLAVMQAEKAGEADEDGVKDALKEVLKRHPEWKPQKKADTKSGFKVGVDTTGAEGGAQTKALPMGRVIF